MKKITLFIVLLTSSLLFNARAAKADDVENACGALLCLAGGAGVSECRSYIARYFAIRFSTIPKTTNARKNFLKMCPAAESDAGTATLVDAIVNAVGNCTAEKLNANLIKYRTLNVCPGDPKFPVDQPGEAPRSFCTTISERYIDDVAPAYCTAYMNHDYAVTPLIATYEGDKFNGGLWVDPAYAGYGRRQAKDDQPIIRDSPY